VSKLPPKRREYCETVLAGYGGIVLTPSLEESIAFVNEFAPEHLEVLVDDPMAILGAIKNAGEILLGQFTPITVGNFCLGVNAILPTGGFARSFSAVTVHDYLKRSSIGYVSQLGYPGISPKAQQFAEYEGFAAHAMAIRERNI
jgi:histidinol dehydrogenase